MESDKKNEDVTSSKRSPRHSEHSRKGSHSSKHSSKLTSSIDLAVARKRAEVEAARVKVEFIQKEAEIRRKQAEIDHQQTLAAAEADHRQTLAAADAARVKAQLNTELEILQYQKEAAAAEAEINTLQQFSVADGSAHTGSEINVPTQSSRERTLHYVKEQSALNNAANLGLPENTPRITSPIDNVTRHVSRSPERSAHRDTFHTQITEPVPDPRGNSTGLNPNASIFSPAQNITAPSYYQPDTHVSLAGEFSRFLLKKELLLSRLTNFNDQPESYCIWRSGFQCVMKELQVNASEELDLMVKWLGPESSRFALSLRTANATNPERGLQRAWERLNERYGRPEMVESALKAKLANFPKLTNRDNKRLYDLCDILSEIESAKEDSNYASLLSYFDCSSGIIPIVSKLPYSIQEKWTAQAVKYKNKHKVAFPPFTFFVDFIRETSRTKNDPSFVYETQGTTQSAGISQNRPARRDPPRLTARKTEIDNLGVKRLVKSPDSHCPVHDSNHSLNSCRAFRQKTIEERKKILRDLGICFRCCTTTDHMSRTCTERRNCSICGSTKHPSALHTKLDSTETNTHVPTKDNGREAAYDSSSTPVTSTCTEICGDGFQGKSCGKTLLVKVFLKNQPENYKLVYAIMDDQSNTTLAKSELFNMFQLHGEEISYSLSSCSGVHNSSGRKTSNLVVEELHGLHTVHLPRVLECDQIPDIRDEIASPEVVRHHPHLCDLANHIPPPVADAKILILIGRDVPDAHHVLDQRLGPRGSPYAQRLPLGWAVIGETCLGKVHQPTTVNANKTYLHENGRGTIFTPCPHSLTLKESYVHSTYSSVTPEIGATVFTKSVDDEKIGMSVEDEEFMTIMKHQVFRSPEGNWTAPLPFREPRPRLPNNRQQALNRAMILHKSLQNNPTKREHFVVFMKEILDRNHAELAPPVAEGEEVWYLPIFGVYHPKKLDRIRGVFDSSAQFEGVSLNNVLLCGPDLTNNMLGILIRFRKEQVAITADIQQMFHCFLVREDHRNFLRFLWYKNNDPDDRLVEYRMRVHVFGNSPSPAVATYCLRKSAQQGEEIFGSDTKSFVEENFYVDDALTSVPTPTEAIDLLSRTQQALMTTGNLRLHKITSNSDEVMQAFPQEDRARDLKDLNLGVDPVPLQRSLGVYWDLKEDIFTIQVSNVEKPFTRRGILSTVNSLYDPLGFSSPVLVKGKILFRELMSGSTGWDEPLPSERKREWEDWRCSLPLLETLKIPRTYVSTPLQETVSKEIHIFSDASEQAIAAVAYLRTEDVDGVVEVGFILGKAKVAPSHGHTIPRLELCAAVLAAEIADIVTSQIGITPNAIQFYTDSRIVLGYIHNRTRRFHVYVGNRVHRIKQSSQPEQWQYVASDLNPADQATRSLNASLLGESLWLSGPSFLRKPELISDDTAYPLENAETDKEIRAEAIILATSERRTEMGTTRFRRFSSWRKLVNAIRFLQQIARTRHAKDTTKPTRTVQDYKQAEQFIIKTVQREEYGDEINCLQRQETLSNSSPLISLNPQLDHQGLLRVGGRINKSDLSSEEKNPIIIPNKNWVATLLVRFHHEAVSHQGRHITEGAIRSAGFWIVGGKRLVSSLIYKCVTCKKQRGKLQQQMMADLPSDRLNPGPPFSYVGVDVFGPWSVVSRKTRGGQANFKRWAVMFTCLTTRAVHIEVIEEMSSSSFINARRRFISIRGKVIELRSDRGTNFVGSTDSLGIDVINIEDGPVSTFLYGRGTCWKFNPPHSSHMGGVWERMIGVTRKILNSMLADVSAKNLTHEVLTTLLAEVSAIINARPIVPVSTDPHNPFVLSPSSILTHKTEHVVDIPGNLDLTDMYRAQWKRVQLLADTFWTRWRKEYLQTLQARRKWRTVSPNLKQGDIILLKDKNVHRNEWPMGVVIRAIPSDDSLVRKVEIRVCKDGRPTTYLRPITDAVVLLSE